MRALGVLAGLAGIAGLAGCGESTTFTYFKVPVMLDRQSIDDELLDLIEACAAVAETPLRKDSGDLRCVRHRVPANFGTFEYTTSLKSGAIKFSVVMNNYNGTALAAGEVGPVDIVAGMTITTSALIVKAIPGAPRNPPGVITPVGSDGGAADGGGASP
jgi:hypothetical protein